MSGERTLRRVTGDRAVLGLCAGLARSFDLPVAAVRFAAVVAALVSPSLALVAYAVGALIVPRDDGRALLGGERAGGRDALLGWSLAAVAAYILLGPRLNPFDALESVAADPFAVPRYFGLDALVGLLSGPLLLAAIVAGLYLALRRPSSSSPPPSGGTPVPPPPPGGTPAGTGTAWTGDADTVDGEATTIVHDAPADRSPAPWSPPTAAAGDAPTGDRRAAHRGGDAPTATWSAAPSAAGNVPTTAWVPGRRSVGLVGFAAVVIAGAVVAALAALGAFVLTTTAVVVMLAATAAVCGVAAIAFNGRAGAAGLVGLAVILGGGALAVAALPRDLRGRIGDETVVVRSPTDLDRTFRTAYGSLDVDLRDVAFPAGETRVTARVGLGDITVRVPDDVRVTYVGPNYGNDVDNPRRGPELLLDTNVYGGPVTVIRG